MAKKGLSRTYYKEEQSLSNSPSMWVLYLSLLTTVGITAYGLHQQLVLDRPWGNHPVSNAHMEIIFAVILVFMGVLIFFMSRLTLVVTINKEGISAEFTPFLMKKKHIAKTEIERYEMRKYRPILEYGGWGFRALGRRYSLRRRKWGIAYNVKGNIGLQLYLKNGNKILIGTQNPTGIERAMKKLMEDEGGIVDG